MRTPVVLAASLAILAVSGCAERAVLPPGSGYGPNPALPPPEPTTVPTIEVAPAKGWPAGARPTPAPGLAVDAFATGLDHPRWLLVLPNGDVLVAESNAPAKDPEGLRANAMKQVKERAGSAVPSADRITLLRDADADGKAELRETFLAGLHSPFGMTLVDGGTLYVANTDALVRFPYRSGETRIAEAGQKVADLPAGAINHHWTKDVIASRDGSRLYVTVGSNSNVGENGLDAEEGRALVLEIDPGTGRSRVFASGLRNPNGLAWNPQTGALWVAVNERDEIGNDLVPDYMTALVDGGFYGWPYSYFGAHVDPRVEARRPDLVERALVPDYALGSHTASLGLAFYGGELLPSRYREGAFVGQHGSWNRKPRSGYKVIFVPFAAGKPSGMPEDVLTGFVDEEGNARGRPVGVAVDRTGALLVADDVGNAVWRVTAAR
jgi:glucose/arabinose dehydrogenase